MASAMDIVNCVPRAIWLLTAAHGGRSGGLLATWVCPASIADSRPAVMISIGANHFTGRLIDASGWFAAHLVGRRQAGLAYRFASASGDTADKLDGVPVRPRPAGPPLLENCVAMAECQVFARLDAGDRILFWADVIDSQKLDDELPLTESSFANSLDHHQQAVLAKSRQTDLHVQMPLRERWQESLPSYLRPKHEPVGPPPVN